MVLFDTCVYNGMADFSKFLTLGDDRNVVAVFVNGKQVMPR